MVHNTKIEFISSSAVPFFHLSKIKKKAQSTSPQVHESSPCFVLCRGIEFVASVECSSFAFPVGPAEI